MSAQEHEPIGTVRREPVRNAVAVCAGGGYRVMFPENDQVVFLSHPGDSDGLRVFDWPIIWCPNATYHEQDNIRRAQSKVPHLPWTARSGPTET
jgi:hypothetical protein